MKTETNQEQVQQVAPKAKTPKVKTIGPKAKNEQPEFQDEMQEENDGLFRSSLTAEDAQLMQQVSENNNKSGMSLLDLEMQKKQLKIQLEKTNAEIEKLTETTEESQKAVMELIKKYHTITETKNDFNNELDFKGFDPQSGEIVFGIKS